VQGEPVKPDDADFGITVDFVRGQPDPVQIYGGLAELLKGFTELDHVLLDALDPDLEPIMVIEDVEAESITTWIRGKLESADDEVIKSGDWKRAVGKFALKAKYRVLEYLDKRADKEEFDRLTTLQSDLEKLARSAENRAIPVRVSIPLPDPVGPLDRIQEAKDLLANADRIIVKSDLGTHEINLEATKKPSDFLPLSEPELTSGEMEMVLLVKKPDYLGESLWEFRHGNTPVHAHILDSGWLSDFQSGEVVITPGDAPVCRVSYGYGYDSQGKLKKVKHEVLKVHRVIQIAQGHQTSLLK
jgi:hypothetical protein